MKHITHRNRVLRSSVVALIALAVPLGLAACSSTASEQTVSDTAGGIGARFGACVRDAGIDIADPTDEQVRTGVLRSPSGVDEDAFERAAAACSEQLGVERSSDADKQKWERQYDRVASCIRDHGYDDFPEQEPGSLQFSDYARASEPGFETASMDCLRRYAPDTQVQGAN